MPGEKEAITVYSHGQIYMDSDKVIEATFRRWRPRFVGLGWQCSQTLYSFDVSFLVRCVEVLPVGDQRTKLNALRQYYQSRRVVAVSKEQKSEDLAWIPMFCFSLS